MKISDNTSICMPMRNLLSILAAVAIGVWAYFGIQERLNTLETRATLFEADLVKAADQTPVDQEQIMLIEFLSAQVEKIQEEMESMMSNTVNIKRAQQDIEKILVDLEKLKDKVRETNGSY